MCFSYLSIFIFFNNKLLVLFLVLRDLIFLWVDLGNLFNRKKCTLPAAPLNPHNKYFTQILPLNIYIVLTYYCIFYNMLRNE